MVGSVNVVFLIEYFLIVLGSRPQGLGYRGLLSIIYLGGIRDPSVRQVL